MYLLKTQNIKNSHVWAGAHFFFSKKQPRPNLKALQYQI